MTRTIKKLRRNWAKSTVFVIFGLLAASVVLRVADMPWSAAFAAEDTESMAAEEKPMENASGTAGTTLASESETIARMLEELNERTVRVREREAVLEDKASALAAAEIVIERQLAALEQAEANLRETIALAATASEEDLARLTAVYENMKPADASTLFSEMAPEFAAGFLARMRPDSAGAILAGLDPNLAHAISVVLAGRNANVPTE